MKFEGALIDGRFKLGPRLGSGAQARSHLALDESSESEAIVVVKRFFLKGSGGQEHGGNGWKKFELFEREARVLRSLRHPGIPRFIASFEEPDGVFNLVMERAPGASLRAVATRVRFTSADIRVLLEQVLDILIYLHGLHPPVIHRDIKPANLVRAADGTISLVDFGGVRDVLRTEGGSTVIGTFGYMAPEQLHGEATPATDLYGLGATAVALAGGVEPERVPRKGLRMDLKQHLPSLDEDLRDLLAAMTEPDPADRPASAAVAKRRLASRRPRIAEPVALAPRKRGHMEHAADDLGDLVSDAPRPIRLLLRIVFFAIGLGGYVGLTVIRAALLPIVFGLIAGFASDRNKSRIRGAQAKVAGALDEGRCGFLALQSGGTRRPALPSPPDTKR